MGDQVPVKRNDVPSKSFRVVRVFRVVCGCKPGWTCLVVFASFAAFATIRAPIPGVNEPHYLCKARHFWEPTWCQRDFFLASTDAHTVFFATIGGLTRFLSFEQSAWVGRVVAWLLLAVGWTRLATTLTGSARGAVWSAWLFLLLAAIGNFSGEWVIGGVEAKSFAYAFVWLAIDALHRIRPRTAAAWLGLAISFHPVVGGWGLLSLGPVYFVSRCAEHPEEQAWMEWVITGMILAACSLPGLVPAVMIVLSDNDGSGRADAIQVFERLGHHLNPGQFPSAAYAMYGGLLVVWLVWLSVRRFIAPETTHRDRLFHSTVAMSVGFAVSGLLFGIVRPTPWMMKFYPFRLADILLPMALAVTVASGIEQLLTLARTAPSAALRRGLPFAMWLACGAALVTSLNLPADPNPTRNDKLTDKFWQDWMAACGWIRETTPPDALFVTPSYSWSFKWFAQRAEFVSFKDCPQDAAGIVEWKQRTEYWEQWRNDYLAASFSPDQLVRLQQETGADFLIAHRLYAVDRTPIFRNDTFAVYRLP
ncbi:MAG: hypothetical protein HZA46_15705 [Planctomycetales bacterium]|nr:hypothetical protein [Planctomycetales bacterium]